MNDRVHAGDDPPGAEIPAWAMQQASEELYDERDPAVVARRAEHLARHRQQLEHERHDEYDDPDEGGEG